MSLLIKKCDYCESINIITDDMMGMIYCEDCGALQEENTIVSTLQFNKDEGISSINGQIHRINDVVTKVNNNFITVSNFFIKNTLKSICSPLGLGEDHALLAMKWYKLSLQYNLSRGKSILYTLSACIYLVCRLEKLPHFLMDFSVLLRINVFKIGRIFCKLINLFNLDVPLIDPSLFITRFCQNLELKDKRIINFANRLVRRMQRDWIVTGRRPNGVCGTAILIASRVFNKNKDIKEIAKIVHISISTINKRLEEIKRTETAKLSIKDFMEIWIEKEEDPPISLIKKIAFKKAIIKKDNYSTPLTYLDSIEEPKIIESDSDIDQYILTEEEAKQRERIWNEMYDDYIKEKKKSQLINKSSSVKRKKKQIFTNLEDAFNDAIKEKRLSSKINYNALKSFLDDIIIRDGSDLLDQKTEL